ncbi:bifunctional isocitrate dehydrogenase kinase/phosphatase, partial [Salmonella enterica subsp. enterica serovar 1,4,[5],12:i:-]|nr:bifunctional isocitrate dehydrogenase kinase/phosphatase [Salmonella enterica subsp. enterica serovar 1,4,[5],12:i:-]
REDLTRDIRYIIQALQRAFSPQQLTGATFQIANDLFYRNKADWLVGKLRLADGVYPFLLPIHHSESGALFIDACLTGKAEASIVFGFARSYFM